MNPYALVLDVWKGNLDIDESILLAGGVQGLIVRLNSIDGKLHEDENFAAQWEQAAAFGRAAYFVYTPWETGKMNYEWMADHLPRNHPGRVFVDVEVKKAGYSPHEYAAQVDAFTNLASRYWIPEIYTGPWCLSLLEKWPKAGYWWARYPYFMYPAQSQALTWEELARKLAILRWVPDCSLGECRLWQCSGDRFKLPGCRERTVDINPFNGAPEEYRAWLGAPPAPKSWAVSVTDFLRPLGYQGPEPGAAWPG